jgi:hypothetical protein
MANPNVGQRVTFQLGSGCGQSPEDNINNDYWVFYQLSKGAGFSASERRGLHRDPARIRPEHHRVELQRHGHDQHDPRGRVRPRGSAVEGSRRHRDLSDLEADRNDGDGKVFGLLPAKLENLKNSMRSAINTMLLGDGTGNGSKDINGFQSLIPTDPTTSTSVQAINQSTFTFWRSKQTSGVKTTSAFDNLRAAMRSIYNQCSNGMGDQHPSAR